MSKSSSGSKGGKGSGGRGPSTHWFSVVAVTSDDAEIEYQNAMSARAWLLRRTALLTPAIQA